LGFALCFNSFWVRIQISDSFIVLIFLSMLTLVAQRDIGETTAIRESVLILVYVH
jgi:hypothetical protein